MAKYRTYRTVLHGTCLLNGKHPVGSQEEKECPLSPDRAQKRSERARKAAETVRKRRRGSVAGPGIPEGGESAPDA